MKYSDLKSKLFEADDEAPAPDASVDAGAGDEGTTDPNEAGDAAYLNAVSGGDAGATEGGEADAIPAEGGEETATPTTPDATVPDAEGDASVDAVDSDENKPKKDQNPIAVKPYSERITTTINLLREFGYYDLNYQIQDGNNSIITIAGTMTDQHLKDIKRFCSEIRVNCNIASSKIDIDKFITTITVSNKSNLKSFKDIVGSGEDIGGASAAPSPEGGEMMGGGDMGGGEALPPEGGEETPAPEAAPTAEGGGEAETPPA